MRHTWGAGARRQNRDHARRRGRRSSSSKNEIRSRRVTESVSRAPILRPALSGLATVSGRAPNATRRGKPDAATSLPTSGVLPALQPSSRLMARPASTANASSIDLATCSVSPQTSCERERHRDDRERSRARAELPNLPLEDALQLVHLYAERGSRSTRRRRCGGSSGTWPKVRRRLTVGGGRL